METLEKKVKPYKLREGDVIRNVKVTEKEYSHDQEVYIYYPEKYPNSKGIIFPNDDIIDVGEHYDVVINKISKIYLGGLILSEVFHYYKDILKCGLKVRISKISHKGRPMFKLCGYRGFVVRGKVDIGDKVLVKILGTDLKNEKEISLKTELVSYLK